MEPVFLQAGVLGGVFLVWVLVVFLGIFFWWWIGSLSFRTKRIANYLEATQANLHFIATWLEANKGIAQDVHVASQSLVTISRIFREEQLFAHKDDPTPPATPASKVQEGWRPPGDMPV